MEYQTNRPKNKKRQSNNQKQANCNNFANHIYDFFYKKIKISNPLAKAFYATQNQSQQHNYTQQIPKISISINIL